jgi:tellurite resistance protein TerC
MPLLRAAINDVAPLPWPAWLGFFAFVAAMLALDLGLCRRGAREMGLREACARSAGWIGLALAFNALLWFRLGAEPAEQFLAAYLVELGLSADNLFVFILIFASLRVPPSLRHRVLFWGMIGAIVMRGAFLFAGLGALRRFDWVIYVFGTVLVFAGAKMAWTKEDAGEIHPEKNPAARLIRRIVPVAADFDDARFFTSRGAGRMATPLLIALIVVETTDLVFALDSLPAVLAITSSAFVAVASNIFALFGLRSLYFALSAALPRFRFLKSGLAVILIFVGVKMLAAPWCKISTPLSLGIIAAVLATATTMSALTNRPPKKD